MSNGGAKTGVMWSAVAYQGLHINFAGLASRRNSVAVRSSVAAPLSSSSDEQDDEDEQTLLLLMTVTLVFGGWSEGEDEDDNRFAGALFSLLAHDSKCSIILWPDISLSSSVHCSVNSSWTCPMHRLYPAAYTSGPGGGGAEAVDFRFRYLTVISKISAFSSLFTLERSCPACNQPKTIIDK